MRLNQVYTCSENLMQVLANGAVAFNLPLTTEVAQVIASTVISSISNDCSVREFHINEIEGAVKKIFPNPTPEQLNSIQSYLTFVATLVDLKCQEFISEA